MMYETDNLAVSSGVPPVSSPAESGTCMQRRRPPVSVLASLHADDRGVMSILMLMTLFALVAFIGLVWNTGEYATRKHNIQMAADAAAHAAATWNGRTATVVSATNQLIAENGSAEVILRATGATVEAIRLRLEGEYGRIQQQLDRIAQQRDNNNNNPQGPNPELALELDLKEGVFQAVLDDYSVQRAMYEQYAAQVTPALNLTTPEQLAQRRADIFSYQDEVVQQTTRVIEEQRAAMADFYKCDITLATPAGNEPAPPVKTVDHTNIAGIHVDGVSVPDGDRDVWVFGGTWGQINCPPLARFFDERVARDVGTDRQNSQIPLLQAIDDERQRMGQFIRDMLTVPPDADADTQKAFANVLRAIDAMRLEHSFAVSTFLRAVHLYREMVLHGMGEGTVYSLSTYDLRPIPSWASASVYQDAYNHIYREVYQRNYERLWRMKYRELRQGGATDADARSQATAWAADIAAQGATQIAQIASAEWVDREWPYEITPPENPVPPAAGLRIEDRHRYFTLAAAAKSNDQSAPKPVLTKMFDALRQPMVAGAQAETFNWMEYQGHYGAGDRYDQWMPPRPWRLSTAGGWNWQPKLAFMDALSATLENNEEFRGYFNEGGVRNNDPDAINYIIMH